MFILTVVGKHIWSCVLLFEAHHSPSSQYDSHLGLCLIQQRSILTFPSPTQRPIKKINQGKSTRGNPLALEDPWLTSVILGLVHLPLVLDNSSHWLSWAGQCCFSVHWFCPSHQPHSKSGSAFRHRPQLSRMAPHLYRWTAGTGKQRGLQRCRQNGWAVGCQGQQWGEDWDARPRGRMGLMQENK